MRFKTSLDAFFTNKKEYFDKLKEQQIQNYNLKVELVPPGRSIEKQYRLEKNNQWT